MTSLKSYSGLARDMSAEYSGTDHRHCDQHGNGRSAFFGTELNHTTDAAPPPPYPAATQYPGGDNPRVGTTVPFAVSSLYLRDASHMSLHALTRSPAAAGALSTADTANLVRSRSVDHEFMSRAAAASRPQPSPPSRSAAGDGTRTSRHESVIVDLQGRIGALSRECCVLRVELERTRDQLHASAHSVRAFWSPELKRERALRKDETARLAIVTERLRILLRTHGQVRFIIVIIITRILLECRTVNSFENTEQDKKQRDANATVWQSRQGPRKEVRF